MIFAAYNCVGWTPRAEEALRKLMLGEPIARPHPRMPQSPRHVPTPQAKKFGKAELQRMRRLAKSRMTAGVIARKMGMNEHRVERLARQHGIELAPKKSLGRR